MEDKKNKLILFDWGGIVENHEGENGTFAAWIHFLRKIGIQDLNNLCEYSISDKKNLKDMENVYLDLKQRFDLQVSFQEFLSEYKNSLRNVDYFKDVSEYEKSLKDKCFIGVLSNLCIMDKERIDKQLNLDEYDYVFLSYELGMRKPNKEIYEYVINHVPFEKENILFLDDAIKNIDAALDVGIKAKQVNGYDLDYIKSCVNEFLNE